MSNKDEWITEAYTYNVISFCLKKGNPDISDNIDDEPGECYAR